MPDYTANEIVDILLILGEVNEIIEQFLILK